MLTKVATVAGNPAKAEIVLLVSRPQWKQLLQLKWHILLLQAALERWLGHPPKAS